MQTGSEQRSAASVLPAFAGLHESSLAVALAPVGSAPPRLNLLVPQLDESIFFAGMSTAASAAALLAAELGLPLRMIALAESGSRESYAEVHGFVARTFGIPPERLTLDSRAGLIASGYGSRDLWIATYWTTAHSLQVAAAAGLVDPERVAYLVQDYEPGFFGWSTESTLAEETYHAGFSLAVNSLPLRDYLQRSQDLEVADDRVFSPHFDLDGLKRAAESRSASSTPRIFFYGRPGKPRNLFSVGVAALRLAVAELAARDIRVEVVSAGLPHDDVDLGAGTVMASHGTLDWDGYVDLLAATDVGLSLQKSAHPSHPPLEIAMSGAIAVTNDFANTRSGLHPRLIVRRSSPQALADGIVEAVERHRAGTDAAFLPVAPGLLGTDVADVVRVLARDLAPQS
jgi:hypothetical protein